MPFLEPDSQLIAQIPIHADVCLISASFVHSVKFGRCTPEGYHGRKAMGPLAAMRQWQVKLARDVTLNRSLNARRALALNALE